MEPGTLRISLMSPERKLLDKAEIRSVSLSGSEGQVQVLPQHAAMVGTLETGPFIIEYADGKSEHGVITTGFFEVRSNHVTLLAETVELAVEIDVGRARAAQAKAEEQLREAALTGSAFNKYQLKLQRALIRQEIAAKKVPG